MKQNGYYARTITAAHRGNLLGQQALAVIEDLRHCLAKSCKENHIIIPSEFMFNEFSEVVATNLAKASPWLAGVLQTYGTDVRVKH